MILIVRMALAVALIAPALHAAPAAAQGGYGPFATTPGGAPVLRPPPSADESARAGDWGNLQVDIRYAEPKDPQFNPIRERLMKRQVLEQLRMFLSPLKLPNRLMVQLDQCGAERRPYVAGSRAVSICYEYVARIARLAPRSQPPDLPQPEQMIVGAFVQSVLHEVSVAMFDMLEIPVWGREDDAADKLAGFIMVQFGREVALKVMIGAAWFFDASDRTWTGSDFASAQSPEAQRLYNYLCIAYGSDPATFKFLVDQNLLPVRRAARCTGEYYALRLAFLRTIMPHVDRDLLKKVQSASWLMLEDPK